MKSKTEAIIISSMNLGEADKLVTFFSLDRGMLKGVAKNARKSFKRFGAGLESFTYCLLNLYEREHQELIRIESTDIIEQHSSIGNDLGRAAAGAVMLEMVREMSPLGERNHTAFLLLSHTLRLLDEAVDPSFLLMIFEIKFLSLLGYQPRLDQCISCGSRPKGEMKFIGLKGGILCPDCMVSSGEPEIRISSGTAGFYYQALRMDMDKVCRLKPSGLIMQELDKAFSAQLFNIMGKQLKSREFLKTVKTIGIS
jgi:DNA repair protein RecO (recombination protein O)